MQYRALILVVGLAACGGDSKRDSVQRRDREAAPPAVEPAPHGPAKPLDVAAFGTTPGRMPGAIGRVRTGMSVADVRAFAAWLAPGAPGPLTVDSGYAGMRYTVQLDSDGATIGTVIVDLPDDGSAASLITQAWGAGEASTWGADPTTVWYDRERHLRATLYAPDRGGDLELASYITPAELLAELAQTIGAPTDQLAFPHPAVLAIKSDAGDGLFYNFPTMFNHRITTPVLLVQLGGKVRSADAQVQIAGDDAARTAMTDAIVAVFGKAVGRGPGDQGTMWLDATRGLRLIAGDPEGKGVLDLRLTAFRRLEDLLGDAGAPFAFETTPILGKTKDELATAYTFDGDDIALPGTEHTDSTPVSLKFGADGKVEGFWLRFSTMDDPDPRARERIRALFVKKFGKGIGYTHTGLIYRKADPRIVARLEPDNAWKLMVGTVEPPAATAQ